MLLQAQLGWKLSGSAVQPTDRMWNGSGWVDQGRSMVTAQMKDTNYSVAWVTHAHINTYVFRHTQKGECRKTWTAQVTKVKLNDMSVHKHRQDSVGCGFKCLPLSWRMCLEDRLPPLKPPVTSRGVMMWEWEGITSAALLLLGSMGNPVEEKCSI